MYWTVHLYGGPRYAHHAAVVIGSTIFTLGCDINNKNIHGPIDIHMFDTEKLIWRKVDQKFDANCTPVQKYCHTAVAHGTKIYLFGGCSDRVVSNGLYCFDTETLKWSKPLVSGSQPLPRIGHSACIIGDCIYVYGGSEERPGQFSTELYKIDLNTMKWSIIETEGTPPPYRVFHSATAIGDKMYIFGGPGETFFTERKYCNKVYYFDTTTNRWTCPIVFGPMPMGWHNHAAFEHNGKLYVCGHNKNIMEYNPESSTWKTIIPKGTSPCHRRRPICMVVNNRVFISGGMSQIFPPSAVPLRYNLIQQIVKFNTVHDDLHVLDLNPNLKDICLVKICDYVRKNKLDIQDMSLPLTLKNDLKVANPLKEE